jgi:RNA-directed DNA polymerase
MHEKEQRDLMSAVSARSVIHATGVDRVRALQRVLYRCAKQDQDRRFHALHDKVAGSDVMRRAWRVQIPKPGKPGQFRPLGIPCVANRVVMAAAKIVLEPIFEADFLPTSYGFRPARSAHHALETIRQTVTWRRKAWVLDADIRSCSRSSCCVRCARATDRHAARW